METFNENAIIRFTNGQVAHIDRLLGSGGQGMVYMVEVDGEKFALKWYKRMPSDNFIQNLRKNIEEGSPSPMFLWPQAITKTRFGSVGYLMPLKPEGYEEFSKFRLAKVRFASFRAILTAAIETCEAFKILHAKGLSYQDLNDGGFFIDPTTGHVRICDCDNVFPHGEASGVLGKTRYMAPEVVQRKTMPNSYTDRFSLAMVLFMFFCIDHPFEGANVLRCPCLTEALEQKLFGDNICFIYDNDRSFNRPVRGVHHNALMMWPLLPELLRETFQTEFSEEKITHPENRITEMQWIDILVRCRNLLGLCPHCGAEAFAGAQCMNPQCKGDVTGGNTLQSPKFSIPMLLGQQLSLGNGNDIDARVLRKGGATPVLLLQNMTANAWTAHTVSGKEIEISPKGFVPIKAGLRLDAVIGDAHTELRFK